MYSLLLCVIYLAFISLGLPDSLLGSAWPIMQKDLGVPMSYAGIISMLISASTIVSSLNSDRLTKRFGPALVTVISTLLTAIALFGFSMSTSFWMFCLLSFPYGLGAGAVDAAVNNYVALHYKSKHMSWLHCFWGVGASISPYIMSYSITNGSGWSSGYSTVAIIQIVITFIIFMSLPLWDKNVVDEEAQSKRRALSLKEVFQIKGVTYVLLAFLSYSALECTAGIWATSYLVEARGVPIALATKFASLFFLGITFGRFLCGFIPDKVGDKAMIRYGIYILLFGIVLLMIPIDMEILPLVGLIIVGLGCAPIFPAVIHSTPTNFGAENSQAIIGVQMAAAYTGSTLIQPFFGFLTNFVGIGIYPLFLLAFAILMLIMTELLNKQSKNNID